MTLTDIKNRFKNISDVAKVVPVGEDADYGIRYYFIDYSRMGIKDENGDTIVGHITRKKGDFSTNETFYSNMEKFDNAMKRVLRRC